VNFRDERRIVIALDGEKAFALASVEFERGGEQLRRISFVLAHRPPTLRS
jgi:hypothetical protein